jgi:hypothetical protein
MWYEWMQIVAACVLFGMAVRESNAAIREGLRE